VIVRGYQKSKKYQDASVPGQAPFHSGCEGYQKTKVRKSKKLQLLFLDVNDLEYFITSSIPQWLWKVSEDSKKQIQEISASNSLLVLGLVLPLIFHSNVPLHSAMVVRCIKS
jgi:hypothetical protein